MSFGPVASVCAPPGVMHLSQSSDDNVTLVIASET